jgi:hypothetical protein
VSVTCAGKKCGVTRAEEAASRGTRAGRVLRMRVVRAVWRGCVGGGRSQREELGIFFVSFVFFFLFLLLFFFFFLFFFVFYFTPLWLFLP